jgi:hypothetical protein
MYAFYMHQWHQEHASCKPAKTWGHTLIERSTFDPCTKNGHFQGLNLSHCHTSFSALEHYSPLKPRWQSSLEVPLISCELISWPLLFFNICSGILVLLLGDILIFKDTLFVVPEIPLASSRTTPLVAMRMGTIATYENTREKAWGWAHKSK